jgi:hypothetical protein
MNKKKCFHNNPLKVNCLKSSFEDLPKFVFSKLKQNLFWNYYFAAFPEPKINSSVPIRNQEIHRQIKIDLEKNNIDIESFRIDLNDYKKYVTKAKYREFPAYYLKFGVFGKNLYEKSLEHYLAAKILNLSNDDVYVDIASSMSPTPEIYKKLYGCTCYRQDIIYPVGLHGTAIGGSAAEIPVENGFASKMALHCSFEHFEDDSDIRFIKEASRILRARGRLCIVPLYLFNRYAIQTDPTVLPKGGIRFKENDALVFCAKGFGNRHGRVYDVPHFIDRIVRNLKDLKLTVFVIENEREVHPSCYAKFVALFEKQ